jgi:hypothetical protein
VDNKHTIRFTPREKRQLRALPVLSGCYSGMSLMSKYADGRIYPDNFHIRPYAKNYPTIEYPSDFKIEQSTWNVVKLEDEWFLVYMYYYLKDSTVQKFWKCDQIDGVIELLRDQGIITA